MNSIRPFFFNFSSLFLLFLIIFVFLDLCYDINFSYLIGSLWSKMIHKMKSFWESCVVGKEANSKDHIQGKYPSPPIPSDPWSHDNIFPMVGKLYGLLLLCLNDVRSKIKKPNPYVALRKFHGAYLIPTLISYSLSHSCRWTS